MSNMWVFVFIPYIIRFLLIVIKLSVYGYINFVRALKFFFAKVSLIFSYTWRYGTSAMFISLKMPRFFFSYYTWRQCPGPRIPCPAGPVPHWAGPPHRCNTWAGPSPTWPGWWPASCWTAGSCAAAARAAAAARSADYPQHTIADK